MDSRDACRKASAADLSSAGRDQDKHENDGEGGKKAKAQLQQHAMLLSVQGTRAPTALAPMIVPPPRRCQPPAAGHADGRRVRAAPPRHLHKQTKAAVFDSEEQLRRLANENVRVSY